MPSGQTMKIQDDFGGHVPKLEDQPWPAFPADLMSIAIVTATQCDGVILMFEKMFESRMFFVDKLIAMGGRIVLCDPHRAIVAGPSRLRGAPMTSPDIRAGMAMLLAAVCAEGRRTINNADQIERGYERIDERLNALGARITRVPERRETEAEAFPACATCRCALTACLQGSTAESKLSSRHFLMRPPPGLTPAHRR